MPGRAYTEWAARMAVDLGTGVPWVMCKQDDAPDPIVSVTICLPWQCTNVSYFQLLLLLSKVAINVHLCIGRLTPAMVFTATTSLPTRHINQRCGLKYGLAGKKPRLVFLTGG